VRVYFEGRREKAVIKVGMSLWAEKEPMKRRLNPLLFPLDEGGLFFMKLLSMPLPRRINFDLGMLSFLLK